MHKTALSRPRAYGRRAVGVVCFVEVFVSAVRCAAFTEHVPDDWEVGTEDAAEGLEDGIGAEGHVIPGEVGTAAAEDDGKPDRRYDASAISAYVSSAALWEKS
jgi:hypothetical protein